MAPVSMSVDSLAAAGGVTFQGAPVDFDGTDWPGVRAPLFRYTHLGVMLFVAAQTLAGKLCPLTIWEMALRERAGSLQLRRF